jgi:heat shock protein HtpX
MPDLDHYSTSAADWRKTLRQNNYRTYIIIILFLLIYTGIGLLVDTYLYSSSAPHVPLSQIVLSLVTFKLFPFASIILFAIAVFALLISFVFYDRLMLLGTDYHEITPNTAQNASEKQLYNVVEEMKIAAGLRFMPKVFIIDADYMNAFASGFSEKSAMIAITRGLMSKLNRDELQAVMAHELSHIRHLDIKLTLTASLLANIMIIVLDLLFYNAIFSNRRDKKNNALFIIIMLLRYLLPLISMLLLLYLSRTREYMADAGSVELMRSNQPLASALLKIQNDYTKNNDYYAKVIQNTPHENIRREAYIFDPTQAGISALTSLSDMFSTHPSLDARLAALGFKTKNAQSGNQN